MARRREESVRSSVQSVCNIARRTSYYAFCGLLISFFLIYIAPPLAGFGILFCAFAFGICLAVWLGTVSIFFVRFSLAALLGLIVSAGLMASLIATVDWPMKILPIMGLTAEVVIVGLYVAVQDPEWGNYRPGFIARKLREPRKDVSGVETNEQEPAKSE